MALLIVSAPINLCRGILDLLEDLAAIETGKRDYETGDERNALLAGKLVTMSGRARTLLKMTERAEGLVPGCAHFDMIEALMHLVQAKPGARSRARGLLDRVLGTTNFSRGKASAKGGRP